MKRFKERLRWIIYHPRFELIYFLGGIPKQHINTLHYRNVESVFTQIKGKLEKI